MCAEIAELVRRALDGNRRAAGRVISLVEDDAGSAEAIMRQIYSHTGNAFVIGLTGPPGVGKSTLVDELIRLIRERNRSVGVVAVDPNSPFSGGAILGDRIRMMRHAADKGVFIRSMGARGQLGGLAEAAENVMLLYDAMGMDIVLAETVGVGQSELDVAGAADTTVVLLPPGLGDEVQAIKAGIMEIADIFVVNKADHPQASRTVSDIRDLLHLDPVHRAWTPPIVKTVATTGEGLEDLWMRIEQHRQHLVRSGQLEVRRKERLRRTVLRIAERKLMEQLLQPRTETDEFQSILTDAVDSRTDPYTIAEQILQPASATVAQ
jgi:LAO/AO transport system kinase